MLKFIKNLINTMKYPKFIAPLALVATLGSGCEKRATVSPEVVVVATDSRQYVAQNIQGPAATPGHQVVLARETVAQPFPVAPSVPASFDAVPREVIATPTKGTCADLAEVLDGEKLPADSDVDCVGDKTLVLEGYGDLDEAESKVDMGVSMDADASLNMGRLFTAASDPKNQAAALDQMRAKFPAESACMTIVDAKVTEGSAFGSVDVACIKNWRDACVEGLIPCQ